MIEIYGSTGIVAGIAQAVYLLTAFGLGTLLLLRAKRSGDVHQRMLGWHLILAMGVGYLLLSAALASLEMGAGWPPALIAWLVGLGNVGTILGLFAILLFNRSIFRPNDPFAHAAVWILSGLMVAGWCAYGWTGGFATASYESWGAAVMLLGITGSNLWVCYEPLRYYRLMRRRQKLDLAEPVLVDRFLLWGSGSAARLAVLVIGVGGTMVIHRLDPAASLAVSKLVLGVTSLCGLLTSVTFWLAFHPTPAYLRWVARRYRGAEA